MLKPVKGMPYTDRGNPERYTARDIREFVRSGMDVAEISYPGKEAPAVCANAQGYINRHGLRGRVAISRRTIDGEVHVYLRAIKQVK